MAPLAAVALWEIRIRLSVLLSAGIAASIPADASRGEADGAVRGILQGWTSARHIPCR